MSGWSTRASLLLASLLALATALPAPSLQAAVPADEEIERLISSLAASGCEFERNGRWYDAAQATAHLQRKYDWLRKRDLVPTAELFIERAASHSSRSGDPYRVRCPGRAVERAATWFGARLDEIRRRATGSRPK